MKSNLIIIIEALELGIPIEYEGRLYKLFESELKHAVVSKSKEKGTQHLYMNNVPFGLVFQIAEKLNCSRKFNLILMTSQVKDKIENGHKKEDFTFVHEDQFFKDLESF